MTCKIHTLFLFFILLLLFFYSLFILYYSICLWDLRYFLSLDGTLYLCSKLFIPVFLLFFIIYLFNYLFNYLFIYLFIHSFIHSFISIENYICQWIALSCFVRTSLKLYLLLIFRDKLYKNDPSLGSDHECRNERNQVIAHIFLRALNGAAVYPVEISFNCPALHNIYY